MVLNTKYDLSEKPTDLDCVFLAGSMPAQKDTNWRHEAINKLGDGYHFFDPTNPDHDTLNDEQMRAHIKWELDALKLSDYVVLNFLPDSTSPISLVELGLYMASEKLLVICPQEFYKWRYIDTLCKEYGTPIFQNLDAAFNGKNRIDTIINTK